MHRTFLRVVSEVSVILPLIMAMTITMTNKIAVATTHSSKPIAARIRFIKEYRSIPVYEVDGSNASLMCTC